MKAVASLVSPDPNAVSNDALRLLEHAAQAVCPAVAWIIAGYAGLMLPGNSNENADLMQYYISL